MNANLPNIVAFGVGVDSVANILLMYELGIIPDVIIFADTGGEKVPTYEYIPYFNNFLRSINFPEIVTVRYRTGQGDLLTLEQDILNNKTLPGIVFGYKTCSDKFKIRPSHKYVKKELGIYEWNNFVGFNYDEQRRKRPNDDDRIHNQFLLIDHKITRKGCVELIKKHGLKVPVKSACYYCPSAKKWEILNLTEKEKEGVKRIEANATNVMEVVGLGRSFSWTDLLNMDASQFSLLNDLELTTRPCECTD